MMNVYSTALAALLSVSLFACAAQTAPDDGVVGQKGSNVDGSSDPAPAPSPAPSPAPAPACTPLAKTVGTVVNPASAYCSALGYEASGEDCVFPDATRCSEWAFYRGECGQAHSFCNLHGGSIANKTEDMGTWTANYGDCTLPTGKHCQEETFAHSCSCE